jgi:hypothetical protein
MKAFIVTPLVALTLVGCNPEQQLPPISATPGGAIEEGGTVDDSVIEAPAENSPQSPTPPVGAGPVEVGGVVTS